MATSHFDQVWPVSPSAASTPNCGRLQSLSRLGPPGIRFAKGRGGAVPADSTAFPMSMARGAMFDVAPEMRVGEVIGLELRSSWAGSRPVAVRCAPQ